MMKNTRLYNGDCLEVMDRLIEEGITVDAIITDPPYQTTSCNWDTLIPFNNYLMLQKSNRSKKLIPVYRDEYILRELKNGRDYKEICDYFDENSKEGMWQKLNKLIKDNGAIVLFGSEPFSSALRMSNIKNYKYDWKWDKVVGSNFVHAKRMPLKAYEDIMIFNAKNVYNPQMEIRDKKNERKSGVTNGRNLVNVKFIQTDTKNKMKYPTNKIEINRLKNELNSNKIIHPTQKPIALMEYLIKTYTNENELILDFTAGSFTTLVACQNTNRRGIGIELDEKYFNIAKERIEKVENKLF